jgi:tetratricopeptide (TPR) repeat protein
LKMSKAIRRSAIQPPTAGSASVAVRFFSSRWRFLAALGLIAVATLVAYFPILHGGFVWDDDRLVTQNDLVQAPDGLYRIWFTSEPVDYWPLTNSVFWLEWRLWGMNPTGYHLTNLLLHFLSCLLLWAVLRELSVQGAYLAALLFAVHPVNVESVAWIAQLKNVLSMFFLLLTVLWYFRFDVRPPANSQPKQPPERRNLQGGLIWYALSLAAFVLAMLSKGSVAILPLLLLLVVWWRYGQLTKRDFIRMVPFFAVAVGLTLVNIWFQTHGGSESVRNASLIERLLGAGAAIWFYLFKAILPVDLAFFYPQWHISAANVLWWLPLLATLAVTILVYLRRSRWWDRPLLFAWAFFCIALLPAIGLIDTAYMRFSLVADHYQYIAILAPLALVAAVWSYWNRNSQAAIQTVASITAVAAVGAAVLLTWQQSSLYESEITMYEATLRVNPDSWVVHYNLANALATAGRPQEAVEQYRCVLKIKPDHVEASYNLGNELANSGRTQEAIEQYQEVLRLKPDWQAEVDCALGVTLAKAGHPQQAIERYQEALRLKPDYAEAHCNLGAVLDQFQRPQDAIGQFQQALALRPNFAEAHFKMAAALVQTGKLPEAIDHYQQALQLQPNSADIHTAFALALTKAGHAQEAIDQYNQALRLNPNYAEVHYNLANTLFKAGRTQEALEQYQTAVRLKPVFVEAYNGLGGALLTMARPQEAVKYFEQALQIKPDYFQATANLANAYAQTNHSGEAIATAQKALNMARSQGQTALAQQMEAWLTKYRASLSKTPGSVPNSEQTPAIPLPPH